MKITTDNNIDQFILLDLNKVYITFDDDSEVKLNNITDYDIDLNKIENSTIELTTEFSSAELENRFKGKKINHINLIHIEAKGYVAGEDKDRMITLELIINNQSTYKFQYCPEWTCSQ